MKSKLKELDVDFIGGQEEPITEKEEFAISAYLRTQKEKRRLQTIRKLKIKTSQKSHQPV